MATAEADQGARWKRKYYESLDALERREQQAEEVEALLVRSLSRLCASLQGLDPGLDRQLDRVRTAAREKQPPRKVAELAAAITGATATSPPPDDGPSPWAPALARAIETIDWPPTAQRGAKRLVRKLAKTADVDTLAADLGALIAEAMPERMADADAAKPRWRQWLGRTAATEPEPEAESRAGTGTDVADISIRAELALLIAALHASEDAEGAAAGFEERLQAAAGLGDEIVILGELAARAAGLAETLERERAAMHAYLADLSGRLSELDGALELRSDRDAAERTESERFGAEMRAHTGALRRATRDAARLEDLQQMVESRVGELEGHVTGYLERKEAQAQAAIAEAERLRARIAEAEAEADTLRESIDLHQTRALTDPLTEVPNRRAFDERLEVQASAWRGERRPCALAMVDIDHFKAVNDTYGHQAGDRVLQAVAAKLAAGLGEDGFVARFGGEEFALLLPDADLDAATARVEGLRAAIESTGFRFEGEPIPITASCGVSAFAGEADADALVASADAALYEAKQSGRNQVCNKAL